MTAPKLLVAACLAIALSGAAEAQGYKTPDQGYAPGPNQGQGYNQGPDQGQGFGGGQNYPGRGNYQQQQQQPAQGFSFQGDQIPPSHDQRQYGRYDQRYSQTYQQQRAEPQRPGGGCLRYGAVGAAGGALAGHGVLGAVAGCVAGRVVRNRDRARIEQEERSAPQ